MFGYRWRVDVFYQSINLTAGKEWLIESRRYRFWLSAWLYSKHVEKFVFGSYTRARISRIW